VINKTHGSIRTGTLLLIITGVNLALGFVVSVLLVRLLGVESYGRYSYLIALAGMVLIPVQFGLPGLMTREIAKIRGTNKYELLPGLLIWGISATATLIATVSVVLYTSTIYSQSSNTYLDNGLLVSMLLLITSLGLASLYAGVFQGFEKQISARIPDGLLRPTLFIVFIVICYLLNLNNLEQLFRANSIAALIATLVATVLLASYLRQSTIKWGVRVYLHRQWASATCNLALLTGVAVINRRLDLILIGNLSDDTEVAYYAIATQLASLILIGQTIVNLMIGPKIARFFASGGKERVQQLAIDATKISVSIAFIAIVSVIAFGQPVIRLTFGAEMIAVYLPLLILAIGAGASACCGPTGTLLRMTGNEKTSVRIIIFIITIKLALSFYIVPIYGAAGAALLTAFSLALLQLIMAYHCIKLTGIDGGVWRFFSKHK